MEMHDSNCELIRNKHENMHKSKEKSTVTKNVEK